MNSGLGITSAKCRTHQVLLHGRADKGDQLVDARRCHWFNPQLIARERQPHQMRRDQFDAQLCVAHRFGADYDEYVRHVPRWIPQPTAWEPSRL